MAHILAHDPARQLPLYAQGFAAGRDVGLRIGLEAIVKEADRQRDLAIIANLGVPGAASYATATKHEYTAARLSDVATVVAVYFRQAPR
jgi:hypothetical protein